MSVLRTMLFAVFASLALPAFAQDDPPSLTDEGDTTNEGDGQGSNNAEAD